MAETTSTSGKAGNETLPPIKSYSVQVEGFPPIIYSARTRGKAIAEAYRSYISAFDIKFKDFLRITRATRTDDPPGVGKRILVSGKPATTINHYGAGHYVHFIYDDGDVPLCSHPLDVQDLSTPTGDAKP